jgi:hypothetical protein
VVVGIGVPFLSFGILYSNGMGGSAPRNLKMLWIDRQEAATS